MDQSAMAFAKWAALRDFEPGSIPAAWRKLTINPLGSAALLAAGTFLPVYYASAPLARGITMGWGKLKGKTTAEIARDMAEAEYQAPQMRGSLAGAAAALAAGLSLAHTYVPRSVNPEHGGWRSWLNWEPKLEPETAKRYQLSPEDLRKVSSQKAAQDQVSAEGMYLNALSTHPGVPVKYSLDLIWDDKFLDGRSKVTAALPFENLAGGRTGMTSERSLAQGAIRAGFGLGAGYIAGKALGTVFSAPQPVTQALSATGALAGMLKGTGVF